MKKKLVLFLILCVGVLSFSACKTNELNLNNYLIENRSHLFVSQDDLYSLTLSSGKRESDYAFDGIVNSPVDFGILSFSKLDRSPLANDSYTYIVKIDDQTFTGFLQHNEIDNCYSADIEFSAQPGSKINAQITFTGYNYNQDLTVVSDNFKVDSKKAVDIANKELKQSLKDLTSDKNNKLEAVVKILKDHSGEINTYYWYVGVVSTNGDILSILIDANTGDVIAKKV